MDTHRVDVVIVGAGLAGSAVAWAVAGRGRSVAVVEAFQPGHRRGSSHGSARIFRRAYPDPLYVRLTGQAQRLWRQLSDEAGEELILPTGALDFGPSRDQEKMYDILTAFGVPAELMPALAAAERWPGMSFGTDPVMFHPDGGVLDAERAMTAMRAIATAHGAQFHYGSPVLSVQPSQPGEAGGAAGAGGASVPGAVVRTADQTWYAPVVIVAAGAWLEPLLGGQVRLPPLVVRQQQAFHFAPAGPNAEPWPTFIYHDEVSWYGLLAGRDGEVPGAVKMGEHGNGTVTTGDDRDGIVSPAARDRIRAFVSQRLAGLDPAPIGEVTCLYTMTASEDFILDREGPFVVCSPCSGHGAKFAPLVGQIAADLACNGARPDSRFSLAAHRG
jgi:sarcosine oxidase